MLYVDVEDTCRAYENFARKILNGEVKGKDNSLAHIFNVYYPEAVTILELAEIVRDAIVKYSDGRIRSEIEVVDAAQLSVFSEEDKKLVRVDLSKSIKLLGTRKVEESKGVYRGNC